MTNVLDAPPEMVTLEAPPSPEAVEIQPRSEKFVTFQLGENVYAVYAPAVAEVMHPLQVTLLPNAPACLLGIAPLRGDIVAVIDLRSLIGEPSSRTSGPKAKQLVLKRKSDDSVPIAFVVDRLGEIVNLQITSLGRTDGMNDLIVGEASQDERRFRIIDHTKALSVFDLAL